MTKLEERLNKLLGTGQDKKAWGFGAATKTVDQSGLTSQVVNLIIEQAILERASDIHLEPIENTMRIRYRIDGLLYEALNLDPHLNLNILPRVKIMAGLETDAMAKRKAQDGRFSSPYGASQYDFRVATFPTLEGEKIVIRILDKSASIQRLDMIGLNPDDERRIDKLLQLKNGLILVCGPTGSGKTTTLYAMIHKLNQPENNVITLEDPVEYKIRGMNQCDINSKIDFGFADGLKAVLRQDPNIILVGEVRDKDTADIATRAAITGHLVLSSLHANSAIGTVLRLINMGLDQAIVSYAMIGAIAQRLVRRICDHCKEAYAVSPQQAQRLKEMYGINLNILPGKASIQEPQSIEYLVAHTSDSMKNNRQAVTFYQGKGCLECNGRGYKGRVGVFEVVCFDQDLRDAILRRAPSRELEEMAVKNGTRLLAMDALDKARQGLTTLDEIYPLLIEE